jgi:hypothetical protein
MSPPRRISTAEQLILAYENRNKSRDNFAIGRFCLLPASKLLDAPAQQPI